MERFNKLISNVKQDKRVLAIALFGSSLEGDGRDVDICLILDKKYSNLEMSKIRLKLSKKFSKRFDIHVFQQLPLYIRMRVLKKNKIIFSTDIDKLYGIVFSTINEFGFYKKIYDNYLDEVSNG